MATLRFTDRKGNKKRTDEESVWMGLQLDKQVWKLNNNIFWNKQKRQELCHLQPLFHSVILSSFFSWLLPNVISTWSSQPDVTSTANVSCHKNRPYITGKSQWTRTAVQSHIAILMPKAPYCSLSKCTYWVSTGTSPTSLSYQPCEPHPHHIQGSYPQKKKKKQTQRMLHVNTAGATAAQRRLRWRNKSNKQPRVLTGLGPVIDPTCWAACPSPPKAVFQHSNWEKKKKVQA